MSTDWVSGSRVSWWYRVGIPRRDFPHLWLPRTALCAVASAACFAVVLTLAHEGGAGYRDSLVRQQRLDHEAAAPRLTAIADLRSAREAIDFAFASVAELDERYAQNGPFSEWNGSLAFLTSAPQVREEQTSANHPVEIESPSLEAPPQAARAAISPTAKMLSSPERAASSANREEPPTLFSFLDQLLQPKSKGSSSVPPEATGHTAVYDIQAGALYLPTGEVLEAHSGLGGFMDDVRYVHEKGRGPTPPNVYLLSLRKNLFHGVRAIRLTPVAKAKMFGRDGMLAHPYMLGPTGQSNGCVSIEKYEKFLEAYLRGDVEKLVVISGKSENPSAEVSACPPAGPEDRFRPI